VKVDHMSQQQQRSTVKVTAPPDTDTAASRAAKRRAVRARRRRYKYFLPLTNFFFSPALFAFVRHPYIRNRLRLC